MFSSTAGAGWEKTPQHLQQVNNMINMHFFNAVYYQFFLKINSIKPSLLV